MKIEIGKTCDISTLKAIKHSYFYEQNLISKAVAANFLKAKNKDKQKTSNCVVCGNKNLKIANTIYSITHIQCSKCSHVMRQYSYTLKFLENFWKKKEDFIKVHSKKKQQYISKFLSQPKINKILKFCKIKKNFNWLDLGCGNGEFLQAVKKKSINAYGFDLNQKNINFAKKKNLKVIQSDIEGFVNFFSDKVKFDVVSATGYFDVINNPDQDLKIVNKKMNKEGILMIEVPNNDSMTHDMVRLFPNESIRHLSAAQRSSFTFKSLNYLLKKNGFKLLFRWVYGLDLFVLMNYLTLKNKEVENSKFMSVLTTRYNDFQKIFDEEMSSGTLFVIAKKIKEI